jgi:replication factor A1
MNSTVDILGVVLEMSPVTKITISDGTIKDKRIITIADETNHSIGVILYDELAYSDKFEVGKIVAFKFARVGDFNSCSINSSVSPFDIIF